MAMDQIITALRAIAEPTRLRLVALGAEGEWCVTDLVEILGQSQPRLSRHLRLLAEAGVFERAREGPNVFFRLADTGPGAALARAALARVPEDDPLLAADRHRARSLRAARARAASAAFQANPVAWDELRALDLPAAAIEAALLAALPPGPLGRLLDIGTGTGRMLELLAPRAESATGIDLSREMLALARARLSASGLGRCTLRQADMMRLPFPPASFDLVTLAMVLHYADEPAEVLAEAARVLAPQGTLAIVDLAPHGDDALVRRLAHRWPGFPAPQVAAWLAGAGLAPRPAVALPGPLTVHLHIATRAVPATSRAGAARIDA
jgi:ArsR family transcriptional regulator